MLYIPQGRPGYHGLRRWDNWDTEVTENIDWMEVYELQLLHYGNKNWPCNQDGITRKKMTRSWVTRWFIPQWLKDSTLGDSNYSMLSDFDPVLSDFDYILNGFNDSLLSDFNDSLLSDFSDSLLNGFDDTPLSDFQQHTRDFGTLLASQTLLIDFNDALLTVVTRCKQS